MESHFRVRADSAVFSAFVGFCLALSGLSAGLALAMDLKAICFTVALGDKRARPELARFLGNSSTVGELAAKLEALGFNRVLQWDESTVMYSSTEAGLRFHLPLESMGPIPLVEEERIALREAILAGKQYDHPLADQWYLEWQENNKKWSVSSDPVEKAKSLHIGSWFSFQAKGRLPLTGNRVIGRMIARLPDGSIRYADYSANVTDPAQRIKVVSPTSMKKGSLQEHSQPYDLPAQLADGAHYFSRTVPGDIVEFRNLATGVRYVGEVRKVDARHHTVTIDDVLPKPGPGGQFTVSDALPGSISVYASDGGYSAYGVYAKAHPQDAGAFEKFHRMQYETRQREAAEQSESRRFEASKTRSYQHPPSDPQAENALTAVFKARRLDPQGGRTVALKDVISVYYQRNVVPASDPREVVAQCVLHPDDLGRADFQNYVREWILRQFPWLEHLSLPSEGEDGGKWMTALEERFGTLLYLYSRKVNERALGGSSGRPEGR